jgi:two-component system, NarL family, response regulator LiaR
VAVVDDEPDIHLAIGYILEEAGEFVLAGSYLSGVDALQGILAHPPDLVLMDIRLPDLSGIECTRRLSLALPQLKIIMISALNDRQTVAEALQAGCHHYVTKPFTATQFLTSLRCALAPVANEEPSLFDQVENCPLRRKTNAAACRSLCDREAKVLNALGKGYCYKGIADELNLSQSLVHKLANLAFRKLGVNNRHHAVSQWRICSHCPHLRVRIPAKTGQRKETKAPARNQHPQL